jgi:aspartate kinase
LALIVKKFGGTSLGDLDHVRNAAERVREARASGERVAVVVSAMAGVTDQLLKTCAGEGLGPDGFERDSVAATGEQAAAGVFALVLQGLGIPARSWLGWQVPIVTTDTPGEARIVKVETKSLEAALARGEVPVVAGFQGVSEGGRITTLGRGGSDITAVALAAALKARRCDIYTDVPGIYTADPNLVPGARQLAAISYREILALAATGAKVMHSRAVALGLEYGVKIEVRTSYEARPGTMIVAEKDLTEPKPVSGIACSEQEAKISVQGVADEPGTVAGLFRPLAEAGISVDMIVQDVAGKNAPADVTFTVHKKDLARALSLLKAAKKSVGFRALEADDKVVKVSVVGLGMAGRPGVAQKMFDALGAKHINIQAISASDIKISVLIAEHHKAEAVRALHAAYGLGRA